MREDISSFPTHAEAQAIASLVGYQGTSKPIEGMQYLQMLLEVIQDETISNFLFAEENIELQHFTNPRLCDVAITNQLSEINIEPNVPVKDSLSDHWKSSHFSFSAFAAEGRNFGFTTSDDLYYPSSAWGIPFSSLRALTISRFVRNENEGHIVAAAPMPDWGLLRLEYSKMVSSTHQIRFVFIVNANFFMSLRRKAKLTVHNLLPGAYLVQLTKEYRKCPVCSSQPFHCICPAALIKSKHPFDYDSYRRWSMTQGGSFLGETETSYFSNGIRSRNGTLGSQFFSNPSTDSDLVERLRRMAIVRRAGGESPRQSVISLESTNSVINVDTATAENLNYPMLASSMFSNETEEPEGNANEPIPNDAILDGIHFEPVSQNQILDISPTGISISHSENLPRCLTNYFATDLRREAVAADDLKPPRPLEVGASISASELDEEIPISSVAQYNEILEPSRISESARYSESMKTGEKDAMRRLKGELRKERNRASAQRSNMRKKATLDALKQNIKSTHEKADLLRSKELQLRKENLRLKHQIADSKANNSLLG